MSDVHVINICNIIIICNDKNIPMSGIRSTSRNMIPDRLIKQVSSPPTIPSDTGNANSDPISKANGREALINIPPMIVAM